MDRFVLCLLVKAYLNVSYRRLTGFLRVLRPNPGLSRIPHFNTLAAYNRMPSMEGTLKSLLGHTAEGAWKEESTIAIDSSGLLPPRLRLMEEQQVQGGEE